MKILSYGGSVIRDTERNPLIEVLGWLTTAQSSEELPAMGILHHPVSKIFWIGDLNALEFMPQPLVSNLMEWTFSTE